MNLEEDMEIYRYNKNKDTQLKLRKERVLLFYIYIYIIGKTKYLGISRHENKPSIEIIGYIEGKS